jgi:hypothetical protein
MAKCSKCGSPFCKCGPLHYSESPLNQFGSLAEMAKMAAGGRLNAKSMLDSLNKNNSETSTTSGALAGTTPDAGVLSNPSPQNDNSSDIESRVTALEQNAPSNTLGTAQPVFKPQAQAAAQGIYGQQQVPGTFDRSLDPTVAAPLMKKRKY